jgi:hypothetical protein
VRPTQKAAVRGGRVSPLAIVGAAGVIVGSLGPWITARTPFGEFSASGTDGDGVITLALGVAALVMACIPSDSPALHVAQFVVCGAAAGLALYYIITVRQRAADIAEGGDTFGISASVGWGLWLLIAGGCIGAIAQFVEAKRR